MSHVANMSTMTQVQEAPPTTFTPSDSTFGARLALLRQHMRWGNVAKAATECGIPADSWRNWEEGRRPRDLTDVAHLISNRTRCDIDWLVWGPSKAQLIERADHTPSYVADDRRYAMLPSPRRSVSSTFASHHDKMTIGPIGPSRSTLTAPQRPTLIRPVGI